MTPDHPDRLTDWAATKKITRRGRETLENRAIAAYMKTFEERGREEAEEEYFKHFNKATHGKETVFQIW